MKKNESKELMERSLQDSKNFLSKFSERPLVLTGDVCRDDPRIAVGRCPQTGLVQLVDFSHITQDFYSSGNCFLGESREERVRQAEWNRKRLETIFQCLPAASKMNVLDFGAGTGAFLEVAKKKFNLVYGFDLSEKMCKENLALGLQCYNQIDKIPREINLITFFHVLEHIPEPWRFLAEMRGQFPKADTFVIEVPNTKEALISLYKNDAYRKNHFSKSHLYYFTNDTLKMVLERAGFKVLVNTQLQRYSLANHLGWLSFNKGGGQDLFPSLNGRKLNDEYDRLLIEKNAADSVFIICTPDK